MAVVLGIDPGLTGALVWLADRLTPLYADMPVREFETLAGKKRREVEPEYLIKLLESGGVVDLVVHEKVWGQKGDGGGRAFTFGDSYGCLRTAIVAAGITNRIHTVPPATWRRYHRLGQGKKASLVKVREMLPTSTQFSQEQHHNRADAYLIALWGRKLLGY